MITKVKNKTRDCFAVPLQLLSLLSTMANG